MKIITIIFLLVLVILGLIYIKTFPRNLVYVESDIDNK